MPLAATIIRRVFEDKSIDLVTIATPNHWHALAAIWALQAGKHVYVEKPVSHNVHEGRILAEIPVPFGYPRATELRFEPDFASVAGQISARLREKLT